MKRLKNYIIPTALFINTLIVSAGNDLLGDSVIAIKKLDTHFVSRRRIDGGTYGYYCVAIACVKAWRNKHILNVMLRFGDKIYVAEDTAKPPHVLIF